ncbi:unnamed protein product [Somion occarium]|uniref:Uncharacterized protein n=1 Tax=Somion occarium TaxID=3059160 RepID=A0ABP1D353_9APHY
MATTAAPNHRASLLAGLRTGGVRSTSGPMANVPHTAAPGGSFNMPRYVSNGYNGYNDSLYEEEDELADMMSQNLYINHAQNRMQQPMTAAVDGSANRFAHQQTMGMNRPLPMSPFMTPDTQAQLQALQLQMMQTEIARLQTLQMQHQQQQQYQAELFAQAQRQRQMPQVQPARRSAMPPASAGPTSTSFDLRSATMRRAQQAEISEPLTSVAIVTNDGTDGDDSSSSSSRSNSSPSTPRTASSMGDVPPLSPREEAAKKLYEGLGIGRPVPSVTVVAPPTAAMQRLASQPLRQPRGPPSNNEELVPKNFATRSRRKAIGALLDARERREVVEAY